MMHAGRPLNALNERFLNASFHSICPVSFQILPLLLILQLMKKSVIVPDFEKKDTVPPYKESKHAAKLKRRVSKPRSINYRCGIFI